MAADAKMKVAATLLCFRFMSSHPFTNGFRKRCCRKSCGSIQRLFQVGQPVDFDQTIAALRAFQDGDVIAGRHRTRIAESRLFAGGRPVLSVKYCDEQLSETSTKGDAKIREREIFFPNKDLSPFDPGYSQ